MRPLQHHIFSSRCSGKIQTLQKYSPGTGIWGYFKENLMKYHHLVKSYFISQHPLKSLLYFIPPHWLVHFFFSISAHLDAHLNDIFFISHHTMFLYSISPHCWWICIPCFSLCLSVFHITSLLLTLSLGIPFHRTLITLPWKPILPFTLIEKNHTSYHTTFFGILICINPLMIN